MDKEDIIKELKRRGVSERRIKVLANGSVRVDIATTVDAMLWFNADTEHKQKRFQWTEHLDESLSARYGVEKYKPPEQTEIDVYGHENISEFYSKQRQISLKEFEQKKAKSTAISRYFNGDGVRFKKWLPENDPYFTYYEEWEKAEKDINSYSEILVTISDIHEYIRQKCEAGA